MRRSEPHGSSGNSGVTKTIATGHLEDINRPLTQEEKYAVFSVLDHAPNMHKDMAEPHFRVTTIALRCCDAQI